MTFRLASCPGAAKPNQMLFGTMLAEASSA